MLPWLALALLGCGPTGASYGNEAELLDDRAVDPFVPAGAGPQVVAVAPSTVDLRALTELRDEDDDTAVDP